MAQSSVVIKVKHGDTLRRFSVLVNEDQRLDLNMEVLRMKICSLFNFTPDADFILTYFDEDNDQVTLAGDEDLCDVVKQGLNPVRIFVHLNVDKSAQTSGKSTGSSTPRGSPSQTHQNINPRFAEILKSVPEPLCDALSKLSLELASKGATTPILADLINNLSKVGQYNAIVSPSTPGSSSVSGYEANDNYKNASSVEKHGASADEEIEADGIHVSSSEQPAATSSQGPVQHAVNGAIPKSRSPHHPCLLLSKGKNQNSGHFRYMPMGDGIKDREIIEDSNSIGENNVNASKPPTGDSGKKGKGIIGDSVRSSVVGAVDYTRACTKKQMEAQLEKQQQQLQQRRRQQLQLYKRRITGANKANPGVNESASGSYFAGECPFSGVPLPPTPSQAPYMPPIIQPSNRSPNYSADGISCIFHTGVRCDGCGVLPITGPRFKSKVKYDYDLCSICFSRMGNDADYDKIDFPLARHPWTYQGFKEPVFNHLPSLQVPSMWRKCGTQDLLSKFDSHFVLDVNVLDGTLMAPSTPFTKIWRMQNSGTLPWYHGLQLIWIGGDRFNASDSVQIEIPAEGVNVGNEIDIAVDFIAPELPGRYMSYWRMALPTGHMFGQRVWVLIQVDASLDDPSSFPSPVNASSSPQESLPVVSLNLPLGFTASSSPGECSRVMDLNLFANVNKRTDGDLSSAPETTAPPIVDPASDSRLGQKEGVSLMVEQHKRRINMEDMNFPINNDLLVASNNGSSSSVASPFAPEIDVSIQQEDPASDDVSMPIKTASLSPSSSSSSSSFSSITVPTFYSARWPIKYPMPSQFSEPVMDENVEPPITPTAADNETTEVVEANLLKGLRDMGFMEDDTNKEILRANEYDLERSLDHLCGDADWDPILDELKEMGFEDKETNKKLLAKNNGSLTRVVMDLITTEKKQA